MLRNYFDQLQIAHEEARFAKFIKDSALSGELFEQFPVLKGLDKVPQDPHWHPEGDVWTHTLLVIENLPANATFAMALSALFHDVGKARTFMIQENGRITAHGHENVSKKIACEIFNAFGIDAKLKSEVLFLIGRHMLAHSKDVNIKTLKKLVLEAGFDLVDQLLMHGVADVKSGCGDFTDCDRLRNLFNELKTAEM